MQIQRTPNRWSCVPTAFAMALGLPVEQVIKRCGHDGSEILFPGLPEPQCRQGFHLQEMVDVCLALRHICIPIEKEPLIIADEQHIVHLFKGPIERDERLRHNMRLCWGVCTGEINGNTHACAWDGYVNILYDPTGFIYPAEKMSIDTFWIVAPFSELGV